MKSFWLGTVFAVAILASQTSAASTTDTIKLNVSNVHFGTVAGIASVSNYLRSNDNSHGQNNDDQGEDNNSQGKSSYHGAEMNTTAVLIAGLLALAGYWFLIRGRHFKKRA